MNKDGRKENLIPLMDRTEEERKAIASAGGKAKAEKAKRCKEVADTFNAILHLEYSEPSPFEIEYHHTGSFLDKDDFWVNLEGQDLLMRLCCGIVKKGMDGDLRACEMIFKYIAPREENVDD